MPEPKPPQGPIGKKVSLEKLSPIQLWRTASPKEIAGRLENSMVVRFTIDTENNFFLHLESHEEFDRLIRRELNSMPEWDGSFKLVLESNKLLFLYWPSQKEKIFGLKTEVESRIRAYLKAHNIEFS